jgi:exodeoxyribonuclease VII large subunit
VSRLLDDLSVRLASGLGGRTRLGFERLARAEDRLQGALQSAVRSQRSRADRLAAQLDALSPLRVLGRGYAVPLGTDGRVLKGRAEFTPGRSFQLRVVDGEVPARVEP